MKLIAQAKLKTNPEQASALKETIAQFNACCNWLSQQAWEHEIFGQYKLHKLAYHNARRLFPTLSSQMIVRCIARVADAYKLDREVRREFKPLSAITYDERILHWYVSRQEVSIWAIGGRLRLAYEVGEHQKGLLATLQGQADLVLRDGWLFLYQTCNVEEPPLTEPNGFLGVDLGIVNIAATSDGVIFAGNHLNSLRKRYAKIRARLQFKCSKSAKRLLRKRKYREGRFAKVTNHTIAKKIVAVAKDTHRGIALEDLTGIRERVTVRKAQRRQHNSWAFYDLR
jgi:IS605 OrfB family transposase